MKQFKSFAIGDPIRSIKTRVSTIFRGAQYSYICELNKGDECSLITTKGEMIKAHNFLKYDEETQLLVFENLEYRLNKLVFIGKLLF